MYIDTGKKVDLDSDSEDEKEKLRRSHSQVTGSLKAQKSHKPNHSFMLNESANTKLGEDVNLDDGKYSFYFNNLVLDQIQGTDRIEDTKKTSKVTNAKLKPQTKV